MIHLTLGIKYNSEKKEQEEFYKVQKQITHYIKKKIIPQINTYEDEKAKNNLLSDLHQILKNITLNNTDILKNQPGLNIIDLDIKYNNNYLIFDYYTFDETGGAYYETPLIVIFSIKDNKYYFIQETCCLFPEDGADYCPATIGSFNITFYTIENNNIKEYRKTETKITMDMFDAIFYDSDIASSLFLIEYDATEITYPKKLSLEP